MEDPKSGMISSDEKTREQTLKLVEAYSERLGQQRWNEWIELWADDGTLEFPFAPANRQRSYVGKAQILDYMTATPGKIAIDKIGYRRIFPMQNPEIAVVELSIDGRAVTTGLPYNQSYVVFFEIKNEKIWRYREYWNPLISVDAFGGREAWSTTFGKPQ